MDQHVYNEYLAILREEIVPALGCTEPIAIAYASAKARSVLGCLPEHITVKCSGNIIKNVKAVIVPTTGDMKGIETSAVLGAVGGNPDKKLEVLVGVTEEDLALTRELLKKKICSVELIEGVSSLQIIVEMTAGNESSLKSPFLTRTSSASSTTARCFSKRGCPFKTQRRRIAPCSTSRISTPSPQPSIWKTSPT